MSIASIFGGVGDVKTKEGGSYHDLGQHIIDIEKIVFKEVTRAGAPAFIIESRIVESTNPEAIPGALKSHVISISPKWKEMRMANVKKFLGVMLGIPDVNNYTPDDGDKEKFWIEAITLAASDAQPLAGKRVGLVCENRPTKAGSDFTHHQYGPLIED